MKLHLEKLEEVVSETMGVPVIEDSLRVDIGPMGLYHDTGFRRVTLSMVVVDKNEVKDNEPLRIFTNFDHLIHEI